MKELKPLFIKSEDYHGTTRKVLKYNTAVKSYSYNYFISMALYESDCEAVTSNFVSLKPGEESVEGIHTDIEEVFVVMEGIGTFVLDNEQNDVKKGTVVYVPRNVKHKMVADKGGIFEFLCIAVYLARCI